MGGIVDTPKVEVGVDSVRKNSCTVWRGRSTALVSDTLDTCDSHLITPLSTVLALVLCDTEPAERLDELQARPLSQLHIVCE